MFLNKALLRFAKGNYRNIIYTCFLSVILTVVSTVIALVTSLIVRMFLENKTVLHSLGMAEMFGILLGLICLRFFISMYKTKEGVKCGLKIKEVLRKDMLRKLFELGPAYMSEEKTGGVATTIFMKVEWLGHYYMTYIPTAVAAIVNAVVIIGVLFFVNSMVGMVCLLAAVGMLGCPMLFYKVMSKRGRLEWEAEEEYYEKCLDGIQGIVTLKAFGADGLQKEKIHAGGEKLRRTVMGQLKVTMLENGVLEFLGRLGSAFTIGLAAWLVYKGEMDSEVLVYTMFLISACFVPMLNLIPAWHMGYRGVTASEGIEELLQSLPKYFRTREKAVKSGKKEFTGDISFEHISFAYDEAEGEVLQDVTITIKNQTTTALVGPSGSGKSTLANILAGFYEVKNGKIRLGEEVVEASNIEAMQDLVSVVWQEGHLFYGTVLDNIRIGKPEATYEEVVRVAKAANLHDFIMKLPKGYDTHLGEDGMRFSGGEKQRIAIARAFLRNTPILILDEATSSLDRKNEMEIQRSIQELSKGKTVLVIAHRLSTIQNAEQICILNHGKIQEKGTHEELRKTSKLYQRLMGKQLAVEMAGEGA